jgi:2-aminoadipate transaminase
VIEPRSAQANPRPGLIDFGIGQPGFELLPLALIRRAAEERLSTGTGDFLNYGYEQGDGYFLLALADFLSRSYRLPVATEELFITGGASQALDLICTLFSRPGDVVFVEEPTYFLALRIFADHGLRPVGLPVDEDGLRMDGLRQALSGRRPAFLYTVPSYQNPSGRILSADRRHELARLSREHDFLVVADEVYQLLNYDGEPPPPMAAHLDTGRVISLGSFSKILAPGLRLGWVQASHDLVHRLATCGLLDSGGGLSPFTSNIVRVIVENGLAGEHLGRLKEVYGEREQAMAEALERHLGDRVGYERPRGGFFFWLALREGNDTAELLPAAQELGVAYKPGRLFSWQAGLRRWMRLSFAFYPPETIEQGVIRLARLLDQRGL